MTEARLTETAAREVPEGRRSALRAIAATADLFPLAERSQLAEGLIVSGYLVAFLGLTMVALVRQSGIPAWNTVWGEDGTVFYQQSLHLPFFKALTTTYAGYVQLFPRLAAEIARLFPVGDLAPVMALTGAATLSALGLVVFHASRGHLRSPYARAVLVGAMVLLPVATGELLNNAVDAQWWFMFAAFWVLLWRPTTIAGKVVAFVTCFLATASVPLVGLFIPVVLVRTVALRRIGEHAATAGFVAGLVLQGAVILSTHAQQSFSSPSFHGVPKAVALRIGLGAFTGRRVTDYFISSEPAAGVALGVGLLVGLALLACVGSDRRVRMFSVLTIVLAVVSFAVPVWLRGIDLASAPDFVGARYAATPVLLVVSVLLVRVDAMGVERYGRRALAGALLCLALLAPFWGLDFRDLNGRSQGPAWSAQIDSGSTKCPTTAAGGSTAVLRISPPGWIVTVPCSVLRR